MAQVTAMTGLIPGMGTSSCGQKKKKKSTDPGLKNDFVSRTLFQFFNISILIQDIA